MPGKNEIPFPEWVIRLPEFAETLASPDARIELAIAISDESINRNGGPFGAVITDADGKVVGVGHNAVVSTHDSSAHAELMALRDAQARLRTHDLTSIGKFSMYVSSEPCIMCFGALWWARLHAVYFAASSVAANAIGFSEGPIDDRLWSAMKSTLHVEIYPNSGNKKRAEAILQSFPARGQLY